MSGRPAAAFAAEALRRAAAHQIDGV